MLYRCCMGHGALINSTIIFQNCIPIYTHPAENFQRDFSLHHFCYLRILVIQTCYQLTGCEAQAGSLVAIIPNAIINFSASV